MAGRLTTIQKTTRPDSIWPEFWKDLSKNNKKIEIEKWEKESTEREEKRAKRGISVITPEDEEEFQRVLAKAKQEHSLPATPVMQTHHMAMISKKDDDELSEISIYLGEFLV